MPAKNFWRRATAYFIDLLCGALILTIFAVVLNNLFNLNLVAPNLINTKSCSLNNVISQKRAEKILPLSGFEQHRQIVCRVRAMGVTPVNNVRLEKFAVKSGFKESYFLNFTVDDEGNRNHHFHMTLILYLISPFVFAYLLSCYGKTLGRRIMGIKVFDDFGKPPTLSAAIKREYLKALPIIILGLFDLVALLITMNMTLEEMGSWVLTLQFSSSVFWAIIGVGVMSAVLLFWYHFGSFIRWNGKTYWDRWSGLTTARVMKTPDS